MLRKALSQQNRCAWLTKCLYWVCSYTHHYSFLLPNLKGELCPNIADTLWWLGDVTEVSELVSQVTAWNWSQESLILWERGEVLSPHEVVLVLHSVRRKHSLLLLEAKEANKNWLQSMLNSHCFWHSILLFKSKMFEMGSREQTSQNVVFIADKWTTVKD